MTRAKKASLSISAAVLTGFLQPAMATPSPEWTRDLVIYEIATKAFTSPKGPESGTFQSLQEKLAYLEDLGITGIWLTGHSLSDPHHFYNIWSQYAVIEPDKLDPTLGTPEQFKAMIGEAHRRGIRVFLDVITHGVMAESSLVKQHPHWFRGGTWGMVDYDWYGGHTDLDDWWVRTWTDYVVRYGVDGFRIDVMLHRPDLWARIRENAAKAGHPIVVFDETNDPLPGVSDFLQHDSLFSTDDVPKVFERRFGRAGVYKVKVQYVDGTSIEGTTDGKGELRVRLDGITADKISRRLGDYVGVDPFVKNNIKIVAGVARGDALPDVQLSIDNLDAKKEPRNVSVEDDTRQQWTLHGSVPWVLDAPVRFGVKPLAMEGEGAQRRLYVPTLSRGYGTIELSSHDFKKRYAAQGRRSRFGYSLLFAPGLPLFLSGEEFDANFHALPNMSPDVFGGKNPGQGTWLYGSMLDWTELNDPSKRAMLDDVKRMLAIRKQERAILMVEPAAQEPALVAVKYESDIKVGRPYMRWKDGAAIVVLGNPATDKDAHLKLDIPLDKLGGPDARYKVTDLWNGGASRVYPGRKLSALPHTVKRDKTPRGGIGLLKIERLQ